MFCNCINLTELKTGNEFLTPNVNNMERMFYHCDKLNNLAIKFNMEKVAKTNYMFAECLNLSSIKFINNELASNLINIEYMFYNCKALTELDLSYFKTDLV